MSRHMATHQAAPASAMPTQTQTYHDPLNATGAGRSLGVLRLRGEPRPRQGVRWAADVIDNSNMGKKKSKVCCIYHKPRAVNESSSESSSSSGSESDSEADNSRARMGGKGAGKKAHRHGNACDHGPGGNQDPDTPDSSASDDDQGGRPARTRPSAGHRRQRSPNAYEKMPVYKVKKTGGGAVTITQ